MINSHSSHDDVIKWKHFLRNWPFVRGIHRSPVNSPHKGQWCGAFDVYFDLRPKKRLSKQSWGWWFETQSHPLCRHRNELHIWAHSLVTTPPEKALEHRKSTGTVLDMTFDMTSGDSFEYFTTPFSRTGNRKIVSIYLLKWFACDIDISSFYAVSFRDSKYDPDSTLPWFENV